MLNPYLFYNGNCEAAFKFYEKTLGGRIEMLMRSEEAPADLPAQPGWEKKIMHARMSVNGETLMASDAPPDHFHKPQGHTPAARAARKAPLQAGLWWRKLSASPKLPSIG